MGNQYFNFEAKTFADKESWISAIGKAMIKGAENKLVIPDN